MHVYSCLYFHYFILEVLTNAIWEDKSIRNIRVDEEEKLALFVNDKIVLPGKEISAKTDQKQKNLVLG